MHPAPQHPVLRYHGSKWKLAPWIIRHFPPHRCYVEVFGGGAGVLLRKPPSEVEVYNDLDEDVVNFFRVLREQGETLAYQVAVTPYARAELEKAWEPCDDPVERARRFLVRSWLSIGGPTTRWRSGFRFRRTKSASLLARWDALPEIIQQTATRLKRVIIEQGDYRDILQRYDSPDTLFYCDPPYHPNTRSQWGRYQAAYRFEFSEEDHVELAETLRALQGMVVLSGYPHPLYVSLFERHGWERVDRTAVNQNGRRVVESLWLNPAAQQRLSQPLLPLGL